MKIKLGNKVRDKVTGYEGIATAKVEYLNGCVHICVKPKVGSDGKMPNPEYIDIQQLELVREEGIVVDRKSTGGPQRDCPSS